MFWNIVAETLSCSQYQSESHKVEQFFRLISLQEIVTPGATVGSIKLIFFMKAWPQGVPISLITKIVGNEALYTFVYFVEIMLYIRWLLFLKTAFYLRTDLSGAFLARDF